MQSADLARRFGGIERLFGLVPAARIRESHVVVVGIGVRPALALAE